MNATLLPTCFSANDTDDAILTHITSLTGHVTQYSPQDTTMFPERYMAPLRNLFIDTTEGWHQLPPDFGLDGIELFVMTPPDCPYSRTFDLCMPGSATMVVSMAEGLKKVIPTDNPVWDVYHSGKVIVTANTVVWRHDKGAWHRLRSVFGAFGNRIPAHEFPVPYVVTSFGEGVFLCDHRTMVNLAVAERLLAMRILEIEA